MRDTTLAIWVWFTCTTLFVLFIIDEAFRREILVPIIDVLKDALSLICH